MKTKTIIQELTQEDLVNLLCTATYGSDWLDCYAPDREGVNITEEDCLEDVWAKCLLAGERIQCFDYYAEGDTYGGLDWGIADNGEVFYWVSLQDIIDGLQKCADGNFKADDDESVDMDQPEAEALMQVIMFGELIYG